MFSIFLVMTGGAIGSALRYATGRATLVLFGPDYPWGTLVVNLVGGLLMGVLVGMLARGAMPQENARLLVGVGVLGGFTTFSAFSLDLVVMIQRGDWTIALLYALASVTGSVLALFGGLALTRVVA